MKKPKGTNDWLRLIALVALLIGLVMEAAAILSSEGGHGEESDRVLAMGAGMFVLSFACWGIAWCREEGLKTSERKLRVVAVALLVSVGIGLLVCFASPTGREWLDRWFRYCGYAKWAKWVGMTGGVVGALFYSGLFCSILWAFAAPALRNWREGKKPSVGLLIGTAFMLFVMWKVLSGWLDEHGPIGWRVDRQLSRLESSDASDRAGAVGRSHGLTQGTR